MTMDVTRLTSFLQHPEDKSAQVWVRCSETGELVRLGAVDCHETVEGLPAVILRPDGVEKPEIDGLTLE